MRCFILIALCVAVASANLQNYRFKKLLSKYQQPQLYGQWQDTITDFDDIYGDNVDTDDYYNNDFDNVYNKQGWMNKIDQCPVMGRLFNQYDDVNDFDNVLGLDNVWGINKLGGGLNYLDDVDQLYGNEDVCGIDGQLCDKDDLLYGNNKIFGDNLFNNDLLGKDLYDTELLGNDLYGIDTIKEVEDANVKLASKLYKQTKDDKDDKNTVVSPISIQLALAALKQGARGNTKRQINRVIGVKGNKLVHDKVFKTLAYQLKKGKFGSDVDVFGKTSRINPVTIIAINKMTPAQQWFIQRVMITHPGCQVKHCNFQNQPQVCRKIINNLIARKTNMKINQIVPRDAITDNTKMVLVNALEMKAKWGRQMRNHVTKSAKFFPLETNKVKVVEVMETVGLFKHYEDELVKIVGIPTQGKENTLYVIVPKHKDGLTAVEKLHLQDGEQLKQLLKKTDLHVRKVGVQLPKFQIKHKIDARRTLRKQGVTDAFDPLRADFSGITGVSKNTIDEIDDNVDTLGFNNVFENQYGVFGDKKVHLNKFIHQATIKVAENGITCATQLDNEFDILDKFDRRNVNFNQLNTLGYNDMNTFDDVTSLFGGNMLMGGQKMVKANRAFAFVVKHNPTQQVVLMGRVIDAAQKNIHTNFQTIDNVDQL